MTISSAGDPRLDSFLARLRVSLHGMPEGEIEDILRELRSHIADLADSYGSDIEGALRSLGDPVELGKKYKAENVIVRAECSGSPLVILQGLRHAAHSRAGRFTATVLYVSGYAMVVDLWRLAIERVFVPSWTGTAARLGWWLVPAAIVGGFILKYLTDHTATWWIRRYRRSVEMETS
jgi:uncharacterized membrane protein